jgi:leader peptidase (prepilin peptidase)/N-methyltransferase
MLVDFFILVLGLVIGSFLNVCIYRLPRGESLINPPSHCPSCEERIKFFDNIPVISFILLRGRCRYCGSPISWRYPFVELLTSLLFLAAFSQYGLKLRFLTAIFFLAVLVAVTFIDLDTQMIPNKLMYPVIFTSIVFLLLSLVGLPLLPLLNLASKLASIYGFLLGSGILLIIAVVSSFFLKRETMGGGDIKLAAFMGFYLGEYVILALVFGFFIGAIIGLLLIALGKKKRSELIPFGPYLAIGSLITLFYGPQLWTAYLKLVGF